MFDAPASPINLLDNESEEVGVLVKVGLGRNLEVFLLKFARDGVLMAEDEVNLEERAVHVSERVTRTQTRARSACYSAPDSKFHVPSYQGTSSRDQT